MITPEMIQLVKHCDLEERLPQIPYSAKVRGLYFKNTMKVMREAGQLEEFTRLFPEPRKSLGWYSCREYLTRLAVAGALLEGPENVHQGMFRIGKENAVSFAESLLGQAMFRLLSRDPVKLLKQACAGRRQSSRYGRWEVEFPRPGKAVMNMFEEYIWIESNMLGAAEGTFQSIGREVDVKLEMDSPFQGRHILTWDE